MTLDDIANIEYKKMLKEIVEYVRDLRLAYDHLEQELEHAKAKANQLFRLLTLDKGLHLVGVNVLGPETRFQIASALHSSRLHDLHMVFRAGIESLKYKEWELNQLLRENPRDPEIAALIREVQLFRKEAETEYQNNISLVNELETKLNL